MRTHARTRAAVVGLCAALSVPGLVAAQDEPRLSVSDHGTGSEIADRNLVDRRTSFTEGERVAFWTLVVGGAADDRVQHVWIHEGREKLAVGLAVSGPHWRTWSFKTLSAGSTGSWAVEARDPQGRVLARDEFTCGAAPGD